jgi:PBP1b-binding outer membrane lipoprotein LpoB
MKRIFILLFLSIFLFTGCNQQVEEATLESDTIEVLDVEVMQITSDTISDTIPQ